MTSAISTVRGGQRAGRTAVGTGIGNALEWFDWSIYATFSPFFATQFFNDTDPVSSFLATLAVFGVGFLARPLGGFLFGWIADRIGRKSAMTASVAGAAVGSLLIGLTPNYATIGMGASALLLLARIAQGLSHGGEMPAAQTYVSEAAPAGRRGLWSSLIYFSGTIGGQLGLLLGVVLTATLPDADMVAYGWRIPFLVGGLLGLYALVMRSRLAESEIFDRAGRRERPRVFPEIVRHRKQAVQIIGMTAGMTVAYYAWAVSTPAYAIAALGIGSTGALAAGLLAAAVFVVALPLWGKLSDHIGRKPVLLVGALGPAALVFPMDAFIGGSAWRLGLAMAVVQVFLAASASIGPAVYAELFPTHIRTVGVGVPYSIVVALFGGTAPYLQTWVGTEFGRPVFTAYVVVLLVVSAIVVTRLPETKGKALS